MKNRLRTSAIPVALLSLLLGAALPARAQDCQEQFSSTFDLIQKAIFENKGCTSAACHTGTFPAGGLDLTAGVSYDQLVDQPAQTVPAIARLVPGQKDQSLLWLNVAAATIPEQYQAPLRSMPAGGLPPLSLDELEALRLWIGSGAPRDGVVRGTGELLNACLPPPEPIPVQPLAPPPPGEGIQIHMPRWILEPHSEHEVCFASYYDVTDQVPEEYRSPDGKSFRYKRSQIRQDSLSHHLIVNYYSGDTPPTDPVWGQFTCKGGDQDGAVCQPLDIGSCGEGSGCGNQPASSIACIGSVPGIPPDASLGLNSAGFLGTQETGAEFDLAPGVYNELPMKGMIIWNSHAFNLTDTPGKLEAWLNFYFAPPPEQEHPVEGIFDTSKIFAMNAPAFATDEVCNLHVLPRNAQLFQLSSHMHQRGKRWHTFLGAFTCQGGPNDGDACSPFGPDMASPDLCAGAPCQSRVPPDAGDCNGDLVVTIDELIQGVNIALGNARRSECKRADPNNDHAVSIDELIKAVKSASQPAFRDPQASLLYTSLIYNDPVVVNFDPPMAFPGKNSVPAERTLTYCALYDNGYTNPSAVKRKSTSPLTPFGISAPGILGGPCDTPTGCTAGRVGEPCSGNSEMERNASCDTTDGAGDGVCDACPLRGGVTTEDEMFILLGSYYTN